MRLYFIIPFLCLGFVSGLNAQDAPTTIDLKEGQVFDVILLNNDPDVGDLRKDYFKRTGPIARPKGYRPGAVFGVVGVPTRGNYHPDVVAFGTWPSIAARTEAGEALEVGMSDFHEMRRKIWPTFNLTYYEVKKDISLAFVPGKYYVATMFWAEKKGPFTRFKTGWEERQRRSGGRQIVTLTGGASPFGYYFNPDYLTITEWDSEKAFRAALAEDDSSGFEGVRHLNQFPVKWQAPKG